MNISKKFLLFLFLLALSPLGYASFQIMDATTSSKSNIPLRFYVGTGVGVSMGKKVIHSSEDYFNVTETNTDKQYGARANIFAGGGYTFLDRYYLGAELGSYLQTNDAFDRKNIVVADHYLSPHPYIYTRPYASAVYINPSFTLDVLPGFFFNDKTLGYLRVGGVLSEIELYQYNEGHLAYHYKEDNRVGYRVGLGIERRFSETFAVRANYIFTQYNKISFQAQDIDHDPAPYPTETVTSRPYDNAVTIDFLYYPEFLDFSKTTKSKNPSLSLKSGFYLGTNLGYMIGQKKLVDNASSRQWNLFAHGEYDSTKRNGLFGVLAGYGRAFQQKYYLGTELETYMQSNDNPRVVFVGSNEYSATLNVNPSVSFDILPGFYITPSTLAFFRAGTVYSHFDFHRYWEDTPSGSDHGFGPCIFEKSKNEFGYRIGVGIEKSLTNRLSMTANYIYTGYGKLSLSGSQHDQIIRHVSYEYDPIYYNSFLVGLNYHLG